MHPESSLSGWRDSDLARASLDALPVALCVLDENACVVDGNRPFFRLVDLSAEALVGAPIQSLVGVPGLITALEHALKEPTAAVAPFHLANRADPQRTFSLSIQRLAQRTEGPHHLVHITEIDHEDAEGGSPPLDTQALARLTEELVGFSYSVAHDLRAPLRFIEHFAYLLMEKHGAELSSDALQYAEQIGEASRQTARLVDDLLAFSQVTGQPLRQEVIDMTGLVQKVVSQFQPETEGRKVDFQWDDLGTALGDPSLVQQVFVNLIGNALKFTRPNSAATIEVSQRVAGGISIYTVSDNGVGFDPAESERIFTVFQRYHQPDEFEGSGVGLAVVKRIVGRHGGSVWAEGFPGTGARFHFTLTGVPTDGR